MRKATKRGRRGRAGFSGGSRSPSGFPRRGHAPELAPVARDLRDDLVREVALVAAVARGGAGASRARRPARSPRAPRGGDGGGVVSESASRRTCSSADDDGRSRRARARARGAPKTWRRGPVRARADRRGRERVPAGAGARGSIPRARPPRCAFGSRTRATGSRPPRRGKDLRVRVSENPNQDFAAQSSRPRQKSRRRFAVIQGNQFWSILEKSPSRASFSFSSSFWFVSSTLKTPKSPHTLEPLDYGHGPSGCSRAYLSTMLLSVAL